MDFSDSSDISTKLNNLKVVTKKRDRHPLQEKNNKSKPTREFETHFTNVDDYTFHNKHTNETYEPKLSKYNGLRVYSSNNENEESNESYNNESCYEQQYKDRNSWSKPKRNVVDKCRNNERDEYEYKETFYNGSKYKNINETKKNKKLKEPEYVNNGGKGRINSNLVRKKNKNLKNGRDLCDESDDFLNDTIIFDREEQTLDKLQKELEALKKKQKKIVYSKENILSIIKNEVEKARKEFEKKKNIETELLIKNYETEIKNKDINFKEFRAKTKDLILQYKEACISKVKRERIDFNLKSNLIKNDYEDRLKKYKNAYLNLKEKYRHDIVNLYSNK